MALFADRSDFLSELTLQIAVLELIAKKLNDRVSFAVICILRGV